MLCNQETASKNILPYLIEYLRRPNTPGYQAGSAAVATGKAWIAGQGTDLKAKRSDWW
jgi:hypothetical protein